MSSENWQLTNNAAVLYEKYVYPLMVPWIDALLKKANLRDGERVLEVACGTGFVSRLAAKRVGASGHVVGTDLNEGMVAAAKEFAAAEDAQTIEWREADVASLPFDDASFDLVLCQQGMQFFPDVPAAVRELHRVLVPGGRLVFTIWSPIEDNPYLDALANALERNLSAEAANGLRGAFAKSYSVDFEPPFKSTGFKQIEVDSPVLDFHLPPLEEYLPGHMAALPMAEAIAALPASRKASILIEVSDALRDFTDGEGLDIPSRSEVVSAAR